jgi:hypothetical protein
MYIPKIPVEDLLHVDFESENLISDFPIQKNIKKHLLTACKDGNINKTKHLIVFNTTNGIMKVDASIWMVGTHYILLKQNLFIPIKAIFKVI